MGTRRRPGTTSAGDGHGAATAARHGHEPKNRFGESLFAVTVRAGLDWAARHPGVEVLDVLPRYNPRRSRWTTRVPVLRELLTWNLVIVLRKS